MPPFAAAQYLRGLIDELSAGDPVLLRLDDLQWADNESVEALTWLLRRARGDRLLVAIGTRPLSSQVLPEWRRWVSSSRQLVRVSLAGLHPAAGLALIRERLPDLGTAAAQRLVAHTGGNPLYLRALTAEHSAAELTRMRTLPAPAEYAQLTAARLHRQPAASVQLARAASVLGSGTVGLSQAVAIGGPEVSADDVQPLVEAGLVAIRGTDEATAIQWTHALVRAAVYQEMPGTQRRALHAAAATTVTGRNTVLDHLIAATGQYDVELATELDDHAAALHRQRSHRLAGQYMRAASVLSPDRSLRERRWLDACFDSVLSRDFAGVDAELDDIRDSSDRARRALVEGTLQLLRGDYFGGALIMDQITGWDADTGDSLTRFRIETMLAWARVLIGHDTALIHEGLQRSDLLGVDDPAVSTYRLVVRAHIAARTAGWPAFTAQFAQLPQVPSATPGPLSGLLSWRGSQHLFNGALPEAIANLREAQKRLHATQVDVVSSGIDGMLGAAYWLDGQWDLAAVNFNLAHELPAESIGLLMVATQPLHACGTGDFATADAFLAAAEATLSELAWQEAVQLFMMTMTVRAHAGGTAEAQRALLPHLRRVWPRMPFGGSMASGWTLVHLALAMLWAREFETADDITHRVSDEATNTGSPSLTAAAAWLRGLLAETRGYAALALTEMRAATAALAGVNTVPLYRAHILADYARMCRNSGDHRTATDTGRQALALYTALGARPYVDRLNAILAIEPRASAVTYPALKLTDRERDVLTLTVEGYSYAQIARDLFITQSTVSYHLGNIYAKVGVKSRHALTDWARTEAAAAPL